VDWDQDGFDDLIVGAGDGQVHFFRRELGGDLHEMPVLFSYGDTLDLGNWAAPEVFDWNEDGLPDLLASGGSGWMRLYMNVGSPGFPELAEGIPVQCGGYPINLNFAYPAMADMDGDGLEDLVTGVYSGEVLWFRNEGTPGSPLFYISVELQSCGSPIDFVSWSKPYYADWNNDGSLDIIGGISSGQSILVYLAEGTGIGDPDQSSQDGGIILNVLGVPAVSGFTAEVILPGAGEAELLLFSIDGRVVSSHHFCEMSTGRNLVSFSTDGLPAGTYLLQCEAMGYRACRSITVLGF
jgi:hypothetical protein